MTQINMISLPFISKWHASSAPMIAMDQKWPELTDQTFRVVSSTLVELVSHSDVYSSRNIRFQVFDFFVKFEQIQPHLLCTYWESWLEICTHWVVGTVSTVNNVITPSPPKTIPGMVMTQQIHLHLQYTHWVSWLEICTHWVLGPLWKMEHKLYIKGVSQQNKLITPFLV